MDRHLYEALFESFIEDATTRIAEKVAERLRVTEHPQVIQARSPAPLRPLVKASPRPFVAVPEQEEQPHEAAPPEPSQPATTGSEYLSTAEAAALLSMTVKGLEGMRAKGTGPKYIRVGGRIRYRRSDLTQ